MTCEHHFQFQGVVRSLGHRDPGSEFGARHRVYEDRYYCTRCLEVRDVNPRYEGNDSRKPIEGSVPK